MRRLAVLCAALLTITLLSGASASAGGNGDDKQLRLRTVTTEQDFLDLGASGPSLGDQFIFHDDLFQGGRKIGHDGGVCTVTSTQTGEQGEFECQVTFSLPHGQITTQALVAPGASFPQTFLIPITGGSGRYKDVGGQLKVIETSETEATLVFTLLHLG
jgi:hypothetical protein